MGYQTEQRRTACLYGLLTFILLQSVAFVCVNLWLEWRLDYFRSKISRKGEAIDLLEAECLTHHVQHSTPEAAHAHVRRQSPTIVDFMRDFLASQEAALEQICNKRQDLCIPGAKGVTGDKGATGPRGDRGEIGTPGSKGDPGPVGEPGSKGDPGAKGVKGLPGNQGTPGVNGTDGVDGQRGETGPKGDPGLPGNNGTDGIAGAKGLPGIKGQAGSKGEAGTLGVKGNIGSTGLTGQKGDAGQQGPDGALLHDDCYCLNEFEITGNFSDVINVPYGAPLSLGCGFSKLDVPVTWVKDDGPISKRGIVTGNDLSFQQVLKGDAGTYSCVGPDGILGYNSKSVKIVVGKIYEYDCDFESPCSWKDETTDTLDWTMNKGGTPSVGTGPSNDHTLENANGHYIYLETSAGIPNSAAAYRSSPLGTNHHFCLTFWYHMYGQTVGSLQVKIMTAHTTGSPIWKKDGSQGDQWKLAKVDLLPQSVDYYIVINGIRGNGYFGDIAIDDIIVLDGACP
ncbi:collagen alpha-1(XXVII) chain-like [Haliotis rufescens]|uniref:collagen alpha-1(XXVII) chain-like n=1 Tax=Haliotis rufescens TaxID=6454 RepID=UPI00201EC01F|nr:collagen alpha-1(XXVII) chain-like [Haliotis rufescens]